MTPDSGRPGRRQPAGTSPPRWRVVDLQALPKAERAALAKRLFEVQQKVFRGTGYDDFCSQVIEPPADRSVVALLQTGSGALVGYCTAHIYRRRVGQRSVSVIWPQGGLLPSYRGGSSTFRFGLRQVLREKLSHPLRRVVFLGSLVHVSSYRLFSKYFPRVYPSVGRPMPPRLRHLALKLAAEITAPAVDPADPLVRNDGWVTIPAPDETTEIRPQDPPDIAFFKRRNPGYPRGHGLLVVVPIGFYDIAFAAIRRVAEGVRAQASQARRAPPET